jgi:hypothetical protein
MTHHYIPGVEIDGEWIPDEDGALRRSIRIAARSFETVPCPWNDRMLADLEWQRQCDLLDTIETPESECDREDGSRMYGQLLDESESLALGLVSVLSKRKRSFETPSLPFHASPKFRIAARKVAALKAVDAFVPGGDEARMAKLRRAVGFAARAHGATRRGHRADEVRMVTLTYRHAKGWQANHIRTYMSHVRKWHDRQGVKCRYVWVAELQDGKRSLARLARNAVHYHLALWVPLGTPHMPKSDVQGWWPHGSTRTEKALGAVQYLLHYLKKSNSKHFGDFPDGCRIYSVGGLDHSLRRARRWLGLPGFVQGNSDSFDDWKRSPVGTGGGWIDPDGVIWPSEFRRVSVAGCMALQRVHKHSRIIDAAGPFTWLTNRPLALSAAASHAN